LAIRTYSFSTARCALNSKISQIIFGLDEDGMLKPFRQRQGMPAPGPDLGGWYDNADDFNEKDNFHGFIAGHTFGQYVSGLARAYAVTGSNQRRKSSPPGARLCGNSGTHWKVLCRYRLPGYTFDKTCAA